MMDYSELWHYLQKQIKANLNCYSAPLLGNDGKSQQQP